MTDQTANKPPIASPLKRKGNPNWVKGVSGNPQGRTDKPIAQLARMHSAGALRTLVQISKDTSAPHAARVSASEAVINRAYGRPASFSTSDTQAFKRAVDMTDDELVAIIQQAKLTVVK